LACLASDGAFALGRQGGPGAFLPAFCLPAFLPPFLLAGFLPADAIWIVFFYIRYSYASLYIFMHGFH
jgi:hypothetical protein